MSLLPPTGTSVNISWTQPPFSFTPVNYTVNLTRIIENDKGFCPRVEDNRISILMATITSMLFSDLHDFSTYRVTVTARFSEFGLSTAKNATMEFNSSIICTYVVNTMEERTVHIVMPL